MREIKFRAWEEEGKNMFPKITLDIIRGMSKEDIGPAGLLLNYAWEDLLWMQFTGLRDKNGKEIYEGDIVKTKNIKGIRKSSKGVWVVLWNKYSTSFDGELISKEEDDTGEEFECLGNLRDYSVAVIGNIYENPELLKTQKSQKVNDGK